MCARLATNFSAVPIIGSGNESKPDEYFALTRADMVERLDRPLGRVLDLGCGAGGANAPLRDRGADRVVGVELMPEPAAQAAQVYERVEVGDAIDALGRLDEQFDVILCYDVLEHLVDPYSVLAKLRELAAPGGRIHVSVPNARQFTLMVDLIFRGTFGYTETGHRDNTHLRWFTSEDMQRALEDAGWSRVTPTAGLQRYPLISKPLDFITRGLSTDFLTLQWYFLAHAE